MTGMEHAIEKAARLIEAHNEITRDTEFGGIVCDECGWSLAYKNPSDPANFVSNSKAEHLARALAEAGLLAPAPLREAYVVATWKHTRWVADHAPDPGETVLRGSHGADALHAECAVCREVLLPARFERLPVDPAEGDGSADQ